MSIHVLKVDGRPSYELYGPANADVAALWRAFRQERGLSLSNFLDMFARRLIQRHGFSLLGMAPPPPTWTTEPRLEWDIHLDP